MIKRIEKYSVDNKEFRTLKAAREYVEEELANYLRKLIYPNVDNPSEIFTRVMTDLIDNRQRYINILSNLNFDEED